MIVGWTTVDVAVVAKLRMIWRTTLQQDRIELVLIKAKEVVREKKESILLLVHVLLGITSEVLKISSLGLH